MVDEFSVSDPRKAERMDFRSLDSFEGVLHEA